MALDGTYGGLKSSIADFLVRSDLTSVIPDFVTMATAQLSRRLIALGPVRQMLGTWSTTISAELTNLPSDFMGLKSIYLASLTTSVKIEFAEPDEIARRKIAYPNETGDPQLFSIVGTQIQFWPWASGGSYAATITYWQAVPALSSDGGANWLLTAHPDAYLYTALLQSAPYLKDDGRLQVWAGIAETVVNDIVAADKVARFAPTLAVPTLIQGTP